MLVPYMVDGRTRVVNIPVGASAREAEWIAEDEARVANIVRRRSYYDGTQYDETNLATARTLYGDKAGQVRIPEHYRLHAYSTQIQECVDFLADQLTGGFRMEAEDNQVQEVLTTAFEQVDILTGGVEDPDTDYAVEPLIRDALTAGDLAVELRWDPIEETVVPVLWDSESVIFLTEDNKTVDRVIRTQLIWGVDDQGQERQIRERVEWSIRFNPDHMHDECVRETYWDDDDGPREVTWEGHPMIPWRLLRGHRASLRQMRGDSLITVRAMDTADRYDANEHTAYLIARYNSHGNLAVVGDSASIELRTERKVEKDVADVLTFPGGTSVHTIELPTDPRMIEHQRKVLSDALYMAFGLVRVEPDTINGLGNVTGYALEILNRKTEGTFRRIRRQWKKDWVALCNAILDLTAWKRDAEDADPDDLFLEDDDLAALVSIPAYWDVDPALVFPSRTIKVTMGSGYIVDEVGVRDDFTSGLIDRRTALEKRGLSDEEIKTIEANVRKERPAETGRFGDME